MSRILIALGDQDVLIEANGRIAQKKRWPWMGPPGEVQWEEWMSTLRPLDDKKKEVKKEEGGGPQEAQGSDKVIERPSSEPVDVAAPPATELAKAKAEDGQEGEAGKSLVGATNS